MLNAVITEVLKFRRSNMIMLAIVASVLPAGVRFLQYRFGEIGAGWEVFLASGQELTVLCILTAVILVSSYVFNMEYRLNMAPYIFTTNISRKNIFLSKVIALFLIIILLFIVSSTANVLFGLLAVKALMPAQLLGEYAKVLAWYVFSYFSVSAIVAAVAVIIKKFVLSAVVVFGYMILVFPFHLKGDAYICPLLTPTAVASKIFHSSDYMFAGGSYYQDVVINFTGAAGFILLAGVISLTIGMLCFTKTNAA